MGVLKLPPNYRNGTDVPLIPYVFIPQQLQEKADGAIQIEVKGCTVHECIADLIRRYPDLKGRILDGEGRILVKWMVYINNEGVIASNALSDPVKDGDIIAILPMVAGG